ncbi:hypothetical protein C8046_08935 [Serinibacter arcticus]|uniref:Uncharacterized protein n=1 Tax=Serinibacter arcticus TaxID=1655435 RepID=A0A2U1ZZU2_9MICO|nr:hypothetical protein [Serinibacter arcticus]PWD52470.1 hypothetical protein C8046_08935 [Serinibacter arcticus]
MSTRSRTSRKPVPTLFVQVAQHPSLGVETTSGRPWVGVDQQVGHGSADALYALTPEQYAGALVDSSTLGTFEGECWRGDHPELRLHEPGGGSWKPERWVGARARMLPPSVAGEIWHHVDALGESADNERAATSRALAAGTTTAGTDGDPSLIFRLTGDGAYPRPEALIAGLAPGSDRSRARSVLGDPLPDSPDTYALEGDRLRLTYGGDDGGDGDGLLAVTLERPAALPLPAGQIRTFLEVLGEPEAGPAFEAVATLAGGTSRRWAASSGFHRRLIAFDGGVEVQVEEGRVLSARVRLGAGSAGAAYPHAEGLLPGTTWPPSRDDVHRALGAPAATNGRLELHRFGARDLLITYDGDTPTDLTAVGRGVSVTHRMHRWRSGEFTTFLDILGRPRTDPLVGRVHALPGVRLAYRRDVVDRVEIGGSGHPAERFAAFVDGMPPRPTRSDVPFGRPHDTGDTDDLRYLDQGCVHVRAADGTLVSTIAVSQEPPSGLDLHRPRPWTDR